MFLTGDILGENFISENIFGSNLGAVEDGGGEDKRIVWLFTSTGKRQPNSRYVLLAGTVIQPSTTQIPQILT